MNRDRTITVAELPTSKGPQYVIRCEVGYDEGGACYFTGTRKQRGIHLSMTPIEKTDGGYKCVLFSGLMCLLESAARFNRKRLEAWAATVMARAEWDRLLADILTKSGQTLAEDAPADPDCPLCQALERA